MQNQRKPVLIFAKNGRLWAQAAAQASYCVWVADCFGDRDTLSIADRWLKVSPLVNSNNDMLVQILAQLSQGENCTLICGSGIESCYPLLDDLPSNIQLIGNCVPTIHAIKKPSLFFSLLDKLELPYPNTQFQRPKNDNAWLMKSASGLGGSHIQKLPCSAQITDHYFQKQINGTSGSVLFLADGNQAQLISINKQIIASNQQSSFCLMGIETPWEIANLHQQYLTIAIGKISMAMQLVGLNSLDFIISDQNECLILEVNPRPSASAELMVNKGELFQHHCNACQGVLPIKPITTAINSKSLRYLFADIDYLVADDMAWPIECHDIPQANTVIKVGEPICTAIVSNQDGAASDAAHKEIANKVIRQLVAP